MAHRIERFSSTLKQCMAGILANEINDPLLKFVFISDVIVSPDLKKARFVVTTVSGDADELINRLERAKGFLKRAVAKKMYLKYMPDFIFVKDLSDTINVPDSPGEPHTGPEAFDGTAVF